MATKPVSHKKLSTSFATLADWNLDFKEDSDIEKILQDLPIKHVNEKSNRLLGYRDSYRKWFWHLKYDLVHLLAVICLGVFLVSPSDACEHSIQFKSLKKFWIELAGKDSVCCSMALGRRSPCWSLLQKLFARMVG
jgi:hypothetical protein